MPKEETRGQMNYTIRCSHEGKQRRAVILSDSQESRHDKSALDALHRLSREMFGDKIGLSFSGLITDRFGRFSGWEWSVEAQ